MSGDQNRSISHVRSAHRIFYTMPEKPTLDPSESLQHVPSNSHLSDVNNQVAHESNSAVDSSALINYINENIIGRNRIFRGPFGDRKIVYCDWTASGKSLFFIEDFINTEVLPTYGNTHTTTNVTSLQTTMFRHEAKDVMRNAVRASSDDAVIFVGSGCTGAVHKLIHNLNLEQPPVESVTAQELGCKLIVCLAAASNVTGILVDVDAFCSMIHRYGGLAFWDYATAAPYIKIDMNPLVMGPDHDIVYKDAVYFSMHKFIGGPQTPGVLVAKKALFDAGEAQPSGCGGGTVFFVRRDAQVYLKDVEEREEGGTPAIIESIRAGLAMQLKEAVSSEVIMEREHILVKRIWDRLSDCPNIIVLGGKEAPRLPIISVVIRHPCRDSNGGHDGVNPTGVPCLFLHHNFVSSLLNDLFGVQARGGCACAGPYAMDLLGIDEALAKLYEDTLVGCRLESYKYNRLFDTPQREVIRPGFVRISLPFFYSDEEVNFILDALHFVSTHGWAFLPLYRYNAGTGEWIHRQHEPSKDRKWLGSVNYDGGKMSWSSARVRTEMPAPTTYEACLQAANEELCRTIRLIDFSPTSPVPDDTGSFDEPMRDLRWFLLPSEAAAQIRNEKRHLAATGPCSAPWHPGSLSLCFCPDLQGSSKTRGLDEGSTNIYPSAHASTHSPPIFGTGREVKLKIPVILNGHMRPPSSVSPPPLGRLKVKDVTLTSISLVHHRQRHKRAQSESEVQRINVDNLFYPIFVDQNTDGSQLAPPVSITPTPSDQNMLSNPVDAVPHIAEELLKTSTPVPIAPGEYDVVENNNAVQNLASLPFVNSAIEDSCRILCKQNTIGEVGAGGMNDESRQKKKNMRKPSKTLWQVPPKELFKPTLQAIRQFDMLRPGDRVLVCLSGGKDSLSLLHCLRQYQRMQQQYERSIPFDLGAVTVDPGTSAYDPRPLIPYLAELNVPYYFEQQGIIRQATSLPYEVSSICSFCSRMKRGRIYACARQNGYNVIALGQHLDDVAESFLMSCFHNGLLLTMKANYVVRKGDLRVIRPFVFVREHQTRKFAELAKLPVIPENCPACFDAPKERFRIKRLLAEQEVLFPRLFPNLMATMMPLIGETTTRPQSKPAQKSIKTCPENSAEEQTPLEDDIS